MAKARPESEKLLKLVKEFEELGSEPRTKTGLYFELTSEQREEIDEICDRYIAGRFGKLGVQAIAEKLAEAYGKKFTRASLGGIIDKRRGVKAR